MTEHKIILDPTDYQAPSTDTRRLLMKGVNNSSYSTVKNFFQAQVPNLDDTAKYMIGAQNECAAVPNTSFTGNGTWTVTTATWTNKWDYIGVTPNVWGGYALPNTHNVVYEVTIEGHVYCGSVITFFWSGLRIDKGSTVVTDTVGGAAFSGTSANHYAVRYHNILYLTPTLYVGGYCNIYPHFQATTSPANQVVYVDSCRCHLRMLSMNTAY